jgi:hypothetical protein
VCCTSSVAMSCERSASMHQAPALMYQTPETMYQVPAACTKRQSSSGVPGLTGVLGMRLYGRLPGSGETKAGLCPLAWRPFTRGGGGSKLSFGLLFGLRVPNASAGLAGYAAAGNDKKITSAHFSPWRSAQFHVAPLCASPFLFPPPRVNGREAGGRSPLCFACSACRCGAGLRLLAEQGLQTSTSQPVSQPTRIQMRFRASVSGAGEGRRPFEPC